MVTPMGKPRFQVSADKALSFFKHLRIPDMPGKPTFAEAGRQWQFDFVAELFGGQNPDTLAQTIREAFLCCAKKQYKSGLGAGILLTAAHLQQRGDDELTLVAGTVKAATSAFRTMAGMIKCDDELSAQYKVNNTQKFLKDRNTDTTVSVISLTNEGAAGSRASYVFVDELWTMDVMAKAEGALQEVTGGQASRPEGFVVYSSTMADAPPSGVFKSKLDYARKVQSGGIVDPAFLAAIYEPPRGFNWRRNPEKGFKLSNPNLGASVKMDWLMGELRKVKDDRTGKLQIFLSKHMNLEIGVAQRSDNWPGAEFWERQQIPLTLDELLERSEVVTIGIDGGGLDDLLGFCVAGRTADKKKLSWSHAWCAPIALKRHEEIAPRLRDFEAAGELSIADTGKDVAELAAIVAKVRETGKLDKVGVDRAGLGGILEALNGVGVLADEIVGIPQGWQLATHAQTAERWLAGGELQVAKQDLMVWSVGNAIMEPRSNGAIITKAASGKAKIDPVIALINAVAVLSQNPDARGPKKMVFFSL